MRGAALGAVDGAGAADGLLQRGADLVGEPGERLGEGFGGDPDLLQGDLVEPPGVLDQRRVAAMVHVLADRPHLLQGGRHVEVGTGQQSAQGGALGEGLAAQVDSRDHTAILSDRPVSPAPRITV